MANNLNIDLTGKAVVILAKYHNADFQALEQRIFQVDAKSPGFGALPNTTGRALYGHYVVDGENCRREGYEVERLATPAEVEAARAFGRAQGGWVDATLHCLLIVVTHGAPDMPTEDDDEAITDLVRTLLEETGEEEGFVVDWRFPTGIHAAWEGGTPKGRSQNIVYGVRFGELASGGYASHTVVPLEVLTRKADEGRLEQLWKLSPELRVFTVGRLARDFAAGQYEKGDAWR